MVEKITVSLPEDTHERLHDHLDYGDNRSAWIAQAIEERLDRLESEEGNAKTAATAD
jgi:metal-responsive CopG/Arc/MetJ family transcriptional regulator